MHSPSSLAADRHVPLLTRMQRELDAVVQPLVHNAQAIALLDFPDFANVGDSALWLGAMTTLRRLGAPAPCYSCDARSYDRATLARRLGRGVILLNGGGNFGDLWPRHQQFRERVVADFPDNPIVALPQSMHFDDPVALERARSVFSTHPQLTLLLRDTASLTMATQHFGERAYLAPDLAFGLGPLARTTPPSHDVLWLKRDDKEDRWSDAAPASRTCVDWAVEPETRLTRLYTTLASHARRSTRWAWGARRAMMRLHPRLAEDRLRYGRSLLSGARVIVTDRLHGHILCLLLGVPHVVLDNRYGKLSRFLGTWTGDSPLVRAATSPAEADTMARELLVSAT